MKKVASVQTVHCPHGNTDALVIVYEDGSREVRCGIPRWNCPSRGFWNQPVCPFES